MEHDKRPCGCAGSPAQDAFRIANRGRIRRRVFCSLACIDRHLARYRPGWVASGVRMTQQEDGSFEHQVIIAIGPKNHQG